LRVSTAYDKNTMTDGMVGNENMDGTDQRTYGTERQ